MTTPDATKTETPKGCGCVAWMYESLPREAVTDGQRELQAKHGTPYEFGRSVVGALDMISPAEARAAIEKYAREWREVGR